MSKKITVYSKDRCPFCDRAKALLKKKGIAFEEIDVASVPGAKAEMQSRGGGWTVPQIFAGDQYIGDCERLYQLDASGELDGLLGLKKDEGNEEKTMSDEGKKQNQRRVLIIGSGPAGYTAGLYAARANLAPLLFAGAEPGGQLMITTDVENYPGYPDGVEGPKMMEDFRKQAARFGTEILDKTVDEVDLEAAPKVIRAEGETFYADTVIISTGASAKWIGIPSEEAFLGRGVSACATCDGFFFRDEDIAVVGGGDTAMEEALYLTNFGKSVTVIHRRDELRASKIMQERAINHPKIEFLWSTVVEEVLGDETRMTGLKLKDVKSGEVYDKNFGGLFVAIGHRPNTDLFAGQLELNAAGYLVVPDGGRTATEIPGVFAAGDVRDYYYRQAVTAAGMGCMAAIEAERYLQEHGLI